MRRFGLGREGFNWVRKGRVSKFSSGTRAPDMRATPLCSTDRGRVQPLNLTHGCINTNFSSFLHISNETLIYPIVFEKSRSMQYMNNATIEY